MRQQDLKKIINSKYFLPTEKAWAQEELAKRIERKHDLFRESRGY